MAKAQARWVEAAGQFPSHSMPSKGAQKSVQPEKQALRTEAGEGRRHRLEREAVAEPQWRFAQGISDQL